MSLIVKIIKKLVSISLILYFTELATQHNIEVVDCILHFGVDIAIYGDDETIIAPRIGDKIFNLNSYSK